MQILLQIAVLFAVQKLARFLGSRVNEKWIRVRFCPFKNLSRPVKTGSRLTEILTTSRVNSLLFRNHYSLRAIACSRLIDSGEEAKVKSTRESLAGRFVFVFYFRVRLISSAITYLQPKLRICSLSRTWSGNTTLHQEELKNINERKQLMFTLQRINKSSELFWKTYQLTWS